MAVEVKDIQEVAEALGKKFDEFKETNDKRLDGITGEKGKLAEIVEKQNGIISDLDKLKGQLEAELKQLARPGNSGDVDKLGQEHKAAFGAFIRKGNDDGLADLERKAMNTETPGEGGYAVPTELDKELIELARQGVVMRQECRVITVGTPAYSKLVNLAGTASGWVGETTERPATGTPHFQSVKPTWGEIYANPQATQAMLDDSFFNVESWLATEVDSELNEQEEAGFSYGDGTNKPKGLFAYATEAKADKDRAFGKLQHLQAAGASLTADDLIRLVYALRKPYRSGAKWMMNGMSVMGVRMLKDTEGNYLWRPGLELDAPSILLGYGVAENEEMPDIAASVLPVAFGNFKRAYTILDRMGSRVLRDPFTNKPYVGFYTTKRVGGMLENDQAVKMLKLGAAG